MRYALSRNKRPRAPPQARPSSMAAFYASVADAGHRASGRYADNTGLHRRSLLTLIIARRRRFISRGVGIRCRLSATIRGNLVVGSPSLPWRLIFIIGKRAEELPLAISRAELSLPPPSERISIIITIDNALFSARHRLCQSCRAPMRR